mgnify:CR=1 FL=1
MKYIKKLAGVCVATVCALAMTPFAMLYAACSMVTAFLEKEVEP